MDYSDSDNGFLDMYSEDEPVTPLDSDGEHFMNVLHQQTSKCKSCGNVTFTKINGVLVWKVCKTITNNNNRETIDYETKFQAKNNKMRIDKVKLKMSSNEPTPVVNKVMSKNRRFTNVNSADWNVGRLILDHKHIPTPDVWWVDYFLSIHFGIWMWAKQMRHWFNLDKEFEHSVKKIWLKYLGCWKDISLVGTFTNERSGGLKLSKRDQIKRFEFFTQKQLEKYTECLKATPKVDKEIIDNKEYLTKVKDTYYQLRYNKELWWVKRKQKEASKIEIDTLDFMKNNTIWYNDKIYSKFKSSDDVFNLNFYPELNLRNRTMIYLQKCYPLSSLTKSDKINPINLLRNIKYRSGKLLNINDRTYTIPVLSGIASSWFTKFNLDKNINLPKFVSSRLRKKDKLLLLIFTLDLIAYEYSKVSSNHWNPKEIIKFLRLQVEQLLWKDYSQTINNDSDIEWWKLIARKEVKKIAFEKLLSKFIKYYYDFGINKTGSFKKEMSSIKKSKLYNSNNKLTSIEPNMILTFLILGYYDYQIKIRDEEWHDIYDIYSAINLGKIQYLNYSQVYTDKIKNLSKQHILQVKHLANTSSICRSLRYLLPSSLNSRIKPYIFKLIEKFCLEYGIWKLIQEITKKYIQLQYPLFVNKMIFPFNAESLIFESIIYIYNLVYNYGILLYDVNKILKSHLDREINDRDSNTKMLEETSESKVIIPLKTEFDSIVNSKFEESKLNQIQNSIPWEIKDYEVCDQYSIFKILTVTEIYHKQSDLEIEQRINNDTKEIAEIFDEILLYGDDIIPEVLENCSNENSSIKSSDEESEISSKWNIIEVSISTSSLYKTYI